MKITKEDLLKSEHEIIDEDEDIWSMSDEIRRQLISYYHGAHHLKYRHCKNEMEAKEDGK